MIKKRIPDLNACFKIEKAMKSRLEYKNWLINLNLSPQGAITVSRLQRKLDQNMGMTLKRNL